MRQGRWRGRLVIALAACGSAAAAQTAPPAPEVVVEGQRLPQNKRVCKTGTTTGSIVPSRTCRTAAEWEAIRARGLALLEQLRNDQDLEQHLREMGARR